MTTAQNIQTLSITSRAYVHNALIAAGITGESLDDAMHSRLYDLEDTLTAQDLAAITRLNATN